MMEMRDNIKKIIELMGFNDISLVFNDETSRLSIFINDAVDVKDKLPHLVLALDYISRLMAKKSNSKPVYVDVNSYRQEREKLIIEFSKAAARKAIVEKTEVRLPAMNAYERRLIHVELASRPDVKTESIGEGKERYVIIKPIEF